MDFPTVVTYWAVVGLSFLISAASGREYCVVDGYYTSCSFACCGHSPDAYCCLSRYTIVGIVFGCIAVVCAIAAVVFCIIQKKKKQQTLVRPVAVVNTVPYAYPYPVPHQAPPPGRPGQYKPSSHPLPPGYASHYYPNPAYGPQPPHYAPPPTAPPPAYSYNNDGTTTTTTTTLNSQAHRPNSKPPEPGQNPFAAAAATESTSSGNDVNRRTNTAKK